MYRILIADDEVLMRDALSIMISKVSGFEVAFVVNDGDKAIEICKREKIDIVFMDIMMPGQNGIEVSKEINNINSSIAIYILSAYSNFEFAREALKIKVREYILKPVSFGFINSLLENYKSSYKTSNEQFEVLFCFIKDKDFKSMYYKLPDIIDSLYFTADSNKEQLKNIFYNLRASLIDSIDWLSQDRKNDCNDLFPLTEVILSEKKCLEFWLFNIMDYIFKKYCIKKYILLENIFYYIDKNIKRDIGLNQITDNCSVSQGYLSRMFKSQMNISVMEYIHIRKMVLAKTYFIYTDLSITDVAFKLGYNESSYFSKVFKKYEFMTALQYKKNVSNLTGYYLEKEVSKNYE